MTLCHSRDGRVGPTHALYAPAEPLKRNPRRVPAVEGMWLITATSSTKVTP